MLQMQDTKEKVVFSGMRKMLGITYRISLYTTVFVEFKRELSR